MYKITQAWFLYAVSPVHMGAGNVVGELVDSPIQRESHTEYPLLPASGIKGALRHRATARAAKDEDKKQAVNALFGAPPGNANNASVGDAPLHAGALTVTDGVLIAFPVRTLANTFCYATSLMALARAARLLQGAGQQMPKLPANSARPQAVEAGERVLETLQYQCEGNTELATVADWLGNHALPVDPAFDYFREKLKTDLLLLPDEDFSHFVRSSTSIEPHVRINDATGTAEDGGLFYVENAPPESLYLTTALFGDERSGRGDASADELAGHFHADLHDQQIQLGGDATYGRGQVVFHHVEN